ncbi:MAG: VOC family protein [Erythrobacter sp.]|uniref:VOC family protein n=1 Tax=Erythrobacter sp. TaxID=1042 RepID=UPI002632F6E2|nr:VOC family protein [Erythrobacter sp.]MDJ0978373.1 VOC family protein [Erythrobacter sp.]
MGRSGPISVCGAILLTEHPDELAEFYIGRLGIPLKREEHDGLPAHFGADVGSCHFAIHPPASFGLDRRSPGGVVIALEIRDVDRRVEDLRNSGVRILIDPHDEGFGRTATIVDPEGNLIELVALDYSFSEI